MTAIAIRTVVSGVGVVLVGSSFVGATAAAVVLVVIVLVIRSAVLVIVRETAAGVRIRKVTAAAIRLAEPAIVVIAVGVTAAEATITCGPVVR